MSDAEILEVCSAADTQEAYLIKNALSDAGIEARVIETPLLNAVGELPASAIAPRIWVCAKDIERARKVVAELRSHLQSTTLAEPWTCSRCGEQNEATFEICWNCQRDRDDGGQARMT